MKQAAASALGLIVALSLAACGGGQESSPPATPAATAAPVENTSTSAPTTPPPATASAEPAPPPAPEIPASYLAASKAFGDRVEKFVEIVSDQKATCAKAGAALKKFAADPEGKKTVQALKTERDQLSPEQKAAVEKNHDAAADVERKLAAAEPLRDRCKNDKAFGEGMSAAVVSLVDSGAAPPKSSSPTPKK